MKFVKAPNERTAESEHQRLVARVGAYLRANHGKPIRAVQPILVVQRDECGKPYAALCTHYADGATPEIAIQNLLYQITGRADDEAGGGDQSEKSGTEPPG